MLYSTNPIIHIPSTILYSINPTNQIPSTILYSQKLIQSSFIISTVIFDYISGENEFFIIQDNCIKTKEEIINNLIDLWKIMITIKFMEMIIK